MGGTQSAVVCGREMCVVSRAMKVTACELEVER